MTYHQLTSEERYMLSALRRQGLTPAQIARQLGRHRSTIGRELKRNSSRGDGCYRPSKAVERTAGRRSRSRRNQHFTAQDFHCVEALLRQQWSPEQVSGFLRRAQRLRISHETIYRHVWHDRLCGGDLHEHLRGACKRLYRKRYRSYDSRGRLAGKRHISERPAAVAGRRQLGHWEIDTVMGHGNQHCIVSLVERKTGYLLIGKLKARTTEQLNHRTIRLARRQADHFRTITADNGTEFHRDPAIERALLFRHPAPRLGTRHQREHQRSHPPVPAQAHQHGRAHSAPMQRHRSQTQHPTAQTTRLPDPGGMLLCRIVSVALQS